MLLILYSCCSYIEKKYLSLPWHVFPKEILNVSSLVSKHISGLKYSSNIFTTYQIPQHISKACIYKCKTKCFSFIETHKNFTRCIILLTQYLSIMTDIICTEYKDFCTLERNFTNNIRNLITYLPGVFMFIFGI